MKKNCPFCQSGSVEFYKSDQRVWQCRGCGIVFLSPTAAIADLEKYYGEGNFWRNRFDDPELSALLKRNARELLDLITGHIKPAPDNKFLDIGSHEGTVVEEAISRGFAAVGIEPNKHQVESARKRGLLLYQESLESFSSNGKFKVITISHVLEHLKDPGAALKKIYSLLEDDGFLVIEVPNIESYLAKKHGLGWKFIALEHLWYFSPTTLGRLLEKEGFVILEKKRRNSEIPTMNVHAILQYFFPQPDFYGDRFQMKQAPAEAASPPARPFLSRLIRVLRMKYLLAWLIKLLGREDHLLVIARKNYFSTKATLP